MSRRAVGRVDLHLHDLRHTGLTWAASLGATTADFMYRAGHKSPTAALRYQHAAQERDAVLADALGALASGETVHLQRTKDGRSSTGGTVKTPLSRVTWSSPNGIRTRVATLRGWCNRQHDWFWSSY